MKNSIYKNLNNNGLSILEIIVAMGIFSLLTATMTGLILGGLQSLSQGGDFIKASALAQEGVEGVRSIRDRGFNELIYSRSGISTENNLWQFSGEGTSELIGKFSRYIDFTDVYRDVSGAMVSATTTDATVDPNSKMVLVKVEWEIGPGTLTSIERNTYLTNWASRQWIQSNWSDSAGIEIWSIDGQFFENDGNISASTTGEISLREVATSTYAGLGYIVSSAFNTLKPSAFTSIMWTGIIPPECPTCSITMQIKTAPDNSGAPGEWSATWSGPSGDEDGSEEDAFASSTGQIINKTHNNDQWIKYRAILSGDGIYTPTLKEVKIYYQ
jgi:hypothetical protein